jgi:hypothetical protein
MRITAKIAQQMVEVLEDIKEELQDEEKVKHPFTEWERKRKRVKERLRELPRYVERAADMIGLGEKGPGRPKRLELVQRTMLFLFARLMDKSNRDVEDLHRDEKQYCGLENTCAWKKDSLIAHYSFVFFLWWLFERFRVERGLKVSFETLWWEYCAGVDRAKAQRIQLGEPPPLAALFSYL